MVIFRFAGNHSEHTKAESHASAAKSEYLSIAWCDEDLQKSKKRTNLLLELQTFPLVLILQLILLHLDAFKGLNVQLHLDRQALDVSRALSNEVGQLSMDHPEHVVLKTRERWHALARLVGSTRLALVILRDIWNSRAREAQRDGGLGEGRILGCGRCDSTGAGDLDVGRHSVCQEVVNTRKI